MEEKGERRAKDEKERELVQERRGRGGDICASNTTFPITEDVRGGSQNPRI